MANLLYDEKNDKLTSCEASLLDGEGTETKIDTQRAEVRYYYIQKIPVKFLQNTSQIPLDIPE